MGVCAGAGAYVGQEEAERNFAAAIQEDSRCAMCHWGAAYAAGPYLNKVAPAAHEPSAPTYPHFTAHERERARAAAGEALRLAQAARDIAPASAEARTIAQVSSLLLRLPPSN
jgi:cytochrome c551/c552